MKTTSNKATAIEKANFIVQLVLAAVGVVAVIIYWGQLDVIRKSFEEESRPYLEVQAVVFSRDEVNHQLVFGGSLENTGKVPAKEFKMKWTSYIGGAPMHGTENTGDPDELRMVNPGGKALYQARMNDPKEFTAVTTGATTLIVYFHYSYVWRDHSETRCEKSAFEHNAGQFIDLGAHCDPN